MIVYLAHPIDSANVDVATAVRVRQVVEEARVLLAEAGFDVYCPRAAWHAKGTPDSRLQEINLGILGSCDAVVALLPTGVQTIGTIVEIWEANYAGLPVVIWRPDVAPSYALASLKCTVVSRTEAIVPALRAAIVDKGAGIQFPAYVKLASGGKLPDRPYADDAGFDLAVIEAAHLDPGEYRLLACGIAMQLPPGLWGLILPRSSAGVRGLMITPAVIDPGWRGDLMVGVRNLNLHLGQQVEVGDRLAQIVPIPLIAPRLRLVETEELAPHPRGLAGFGSSGK